MSSRVSGTWAKACADCGWPETGLRCRHAEWAECERLRERGGFPWAEALPDRAGCWYPAGALSVKGEEAEE